jgi:purine-nucleoside phosphorylase
MNKTRKLVQDYFLGNPISISEKILFIKRGIRLAEYKERLTDVEEFGHIWQGLTGKLRNETVSIIATGIGPGLVGDSVYAIDKPGAICLYSGTCGGLSKNLKIGDYFLATQAICADGYCLIWGEDAFTTVVSDEILINSIPSSFRQLKIPYSAGLTFTTSSVVRENDPDFWKFVNPDCQTIEMGCAPFYLAALRSQKRAVAYFWVTDLPLRGKRLFDPYSAEDKKIKQNRYEQVISTDLKILSDI